MLYSKDRVAHCHEDTLHAEDEHKKASDLANQAHDQLVDFVSDRQHKMSCDRCAVGRSCSERKARIYAVDMSTIYLAKKAQLLMEAKSIEASVRASSHA